MKKKRSALQDVADCVGVTKVAVSRFLHNPGQALVVLRGKIATALDELGYIPNCVPDVLPNTTSRVIGVLLPSLTNQIFAEALRGVEGIIDTHDYQTMLAHYGYRPETEQERLESMLPWNIDGLILIEYTHAPHILEIIEMTGISVVELVDSQSSCLDIAVGFDNFEATRQMTTAIIVRGHRHITCLDTRLDERTIIKQKGYEQAILDADLVSYSVMAEQSSSYSSGTELIRQARREYPQLGGVFCTNDNLAVGTAFECQRLGLKIPDDMVITGLYGHDIGQVMELRLASVLAPRERMGSIGTERLLTRVRGESVTPEVLDLGSTLSPGGSIQTHKFEVAHTYTLKTRMDTASGTVRLDDVTGNSYP